MDLKSIDMQIALPRTFEAAKNLQDYQQNAQTAQQHAQAETEKESEWRRKAVAEGNDINKTGEREHEQQGEQQQREKKQQKKVYAHPYKGQQIDFSG
jgi:hypothetical protein